MKGKNRSKAEFLCQSCGRPVPEAKVRYKSGQVLCLDCFEYLDIVELCLESLQSKANEQGADLPTVSPTEQKER
ncbi:hypothetical protein P378_05590 [Desulforamulus profundi]|uniref:Zinc finger DksA/TraR C4-type domain-containing protein n=1 Tax=Desulforamulus profundi TaxID=1383067 RepID=A0A2C6LKG4_9FIRM|nr:TraR/DksA C4-type zinc finger protein [Desulforamulus profundi]PHJ39070.1 hypothetical protein P378_05590 [Desulforamulus profundi]